MRPQPFAPSEQIGLYERLGRAYGLVRDLERSREAYEGMLAETRKAGEREEEWRALLHLAVLGTDHSVRPEEDDELFRGVRRKTDEVGEDGEGTGGSVNARADPVWSPSYALDRAGEALSLARGLGREDLVANSLFLRALLGAWAGRWDGVAGMTAGARSLFAAMGDRAMEAEALTLSAWGEVMLGRPQEALRLGRERLAATRELGNQDIHLADSHGLVLALLEVGEYQEALSMARGAVEAARSLGSPPRMFVSLMMLGDAERALCRPDRARVAYLEMAGWVIFPQYRALAHAKLCASSSLAGDWEKAHTRALRAAEGRGEVMLQLSEPLHRHHEVEALLRGGDGDRAVEEARKLGEHAEGFRRLRVVHLRSLAAVARWEDDAETALGHLREAEALVEEIGLPGESWQVRAELGELLRERGGREAADEAFRRAAETLRALAEELEDPGLREGFVSAAPVRRVLAGRNPGGEGTPP